MNLVGARARLLSGSALALGITMVAAQPAQADSVCVPGTADPGFALAVDCTDPNGNGFTEASTTSSVTFTFVDPAAVASWSGNPEDILTTGYIESTTAGRSVMGIVSGVAVTYNGTASGLVGQAGATGAPTLTITAPSVTLNSGTLFAYGAGSSALEVDANGGAGEGTIDATIDGTIFSLAGPGIILTQSNAAATGDVSLVSPFTITALDGDAVNIATSGSGTITVDLSNTVFANGTNAVGVRVTDSATGGDISVTTAAVTANGTGIGNAIDVRSNSTTGNVTIIANGALNAVNAGVVGVILDPTATGNLDITTNGAINVGNYGIDAEQFGTGRLSVNANGSVNAAAGAGIFALSTGGGDVSVVANAVNAGTGTAIDAEQQSTTGTGLVTVTTRAGTITGLIGIDAQNAGLGGVNVATGAGSVTASAGNGILAINTNAASTGNIDVAVGTGGVTSASTDAVVASTAGIGNVTVTAGGAVTGTGGSGIVTSATTGTTTVNVTAGTVTGSVADGINSTATTGNILVTAR